MHNLLAIKVLNFS